MCSYFAIYWLVYILKHCIQKCNLCILFVLWRDHIKKVALKSGHGYEGKRLFISMKAAQWHFNLTWLVYDRQKGHSICSHFFPKISLWKRVFLGPQCITWHNYMVWPLFKLAWKLMRPQSSSNPGFISLSTRHPSGFPTVSCMVVTLLCWQ